jgi:hypothetical protein
MRTEIETAIAAYEREREIVRQRVCEAQQIMALSRETRARSEVAFALRLAPRERGNVGGLSAPTPTGDSTAGRRVGERRA